MPPVLKFHNLTYWLGPSMYIFQCLLRLWPCTTHREDYSPTQLAPYAKDPIWHFHATFEEVNLFGWLYFSVEEEEPNETYFFVFFSETTHNYPYEYNNACLYYQFNSRTTYVCTYKSTCSMIFYTSRPLLYSPTLYVHSNPFYFAFGSHKTCPECNKMLVVGNRMSLRWDTQVGVFFIPDMGKTTKDNAEYKRKYSVLDRLRSFVLFFFFFFFQPWHFPRWRRAYLPFIQFKWNIFYFANYHFWLYLFRLEKYQCESTYPSQVYTLSVSTYPKEMKFIVNSTNNSKSKLLW